MKDDNSSSITGIVDASRDEENDQIIESDQMNDNKDDTVSVSLWHGLV